MRCPYCNHEDTQVVETRVSEEGDSIRRRRRCADCEKRFTTYERADIQMPTIVKRNGSRNDYNPLKLRASFELALRKRPISRQTIDEAMLRLEEKLRASGLREVASERIGELVMRELKKIDKVAYIRFASVYRSFEDIDEFADAIRQIQTPNLRKKRNVLDPSDTL